MTHSYDSSMIKNKRTEFRTRCNTKEEIGFNEDDHVFSQFIGGLINTTYS